MGAELAKRDLGMSGTIVILLVHELTAHVYRVVPAGERGMTLLSSLCKCLFFLTKRVPNFKYF